MLTLRIQLTKKKKKIENYAQRIHLHYVTVYTFCKQHICNVEYKTTFYHVCIGYSQEQNKNVGLNINKILKYKNNSSFDR